MTSEPPFPANTATDTEQPSTDAMLVLVDVRTGTHPGYDRVVLEFTGPGAPGWTASYAASAVRQGKGDPITVAGGSILDIVVSGTAYPEGGTGGFPAGAQASSGTVVKEVFNDGTFEGLTHVVIGTTGQQPFRVYAAQNPPRVIIDVQH